MKTDFELCGHVQNVPKVTGRWLLLTVDFEAFRPELLPLWLMAMDEWAVQSQHRNLKFCFFLAVENAIQLRSQAPALYSQFEISLRQLDQAGSRFYPHNHYAFDVASGEKIRPRAEGALPRPNYTKRLSLYYDVVIRNQMRLTDWLPGLREMFDGLIRNAGCSYPGTLTFRAGGWDYGSECGDLTHYLDALKQSGFVMDSSACRGVFDTPTWRVGAHFGENTYKFSNGVIEVAPCLSLDSSLRLFSRQFVNTTVEFGKQTQLWLAQPGILNLVLHFDHLFHEYINREYRYFSVSSFERIAARINALFRFLDGLRHQLRLTNAVFCDLETRAWH